MAAKHGEHPCIFSKKAMLMTCYCRLTGAARAVSPPHNTLVAHHTTSTHVSQDCNETVSVGASAGEMQELKGLVRDRYRVRLELDGLPVTKFDRAQVRNRAVVEVM